MRSRVLPVIAIGAALAAVGLAALAAWKLGRSPGTATAEAEGPDLWDPAWKALRACVLGPRPASTDLGEAIAAADLVVPERTCGQEVVALARAAGDGKEWAVVRRGIGELADALGRHGQRRQVPARTMPALTGAPAPDPLPPVLADLEKAVDKVRPDGAAPPAPHVLTQINALPVVVDGTIASSVSVWRSIINVQVGESYADRRQLQFVDGQPHTMVQANYYAPSMWSPRAVWQAYVEDDYRRGRIKVAGATADSATTVATTQAGAAYVWAVIGEGDARLLLYTDGSSTYLARSTDAGASWKKSKLDVGSGNYLATAVSADGNRLDVVWSAGETRRIVLDPTIHALAGAHVPEPQTISPAATWLSCNTGGLWLALFETDTDYVIKRADAPTPSGNFKTQPYLSSCSEHKLALLIDDQEFVCDASSCAPLPELAAAPITVVIGGDVLRYQTWDNVIALWWGDRPPAFARLPGNRTVAGVVDDHGTAIAVLQAEARVEYAPLPK